MVLELSVSHSGSVTVDDAELECGDVLGRGVAIGRRYIEHKVPTCVMPFFGLALSLHVLFFDVVKLFALDSILVLGFLGGAGDAGSEGPEEVGSVRCRGRIGRCGLKARKNVLAVEAGAPLRKFSVVWDNGETSLLDLSLLDFNAPKGEKINVEVDVLLVETLVPTVLANIPLLSRSACKDEVKRGGRVCFEDCIAEEGAGKKGQEAFKVDGAATIHKGS